MSERLIRPTDKAAREIVFWGKHIFRVKAAGFKDKSKLSTYKILQVPHCWEVYCSGRGKPGK